MAIRTVVTMGFGNGTFNGTIPLATLMGYAPGIVAGTVALTLPPRDLALRLPPRSIDLTLIDRG